MKRKISLVLAVCLILMSCMNGFVAFAADNTINVGEGTVVIGTQRYTGQATASFESGKKVHFVVIPPSGKITETITYNGTELTGDTDYFTAVDGGVFEATYTDYSGEEMSYYDFALDGTLRVGKTVDMIVKKVITPSNIKDNKAVEVQLNASDFVLVPHAVPESGVIQANANGTITGLKKGMQQLRIHAKKSDGTTGSEVGRMEVVVAGREEASHDYNVNDTSVITETLTGESFGNKVDADYQYTVKPAHGKNGTSLYYRNIDKPAAMTGELDMIKKSDGITQFAESAKAITEFWVYYDGYEDSSTSLFFVGGPRLRFWLQMHYDRGNYFMHIVSKEGSLAENHTSASGYNQRVPMKRGWNQIVMDGRGNNLVIYCNGFDMSAYIPTDAATTRVNNFYYDRFIDSNKQVNNYMFLDDYKVYSMEDPLPVTNTIEAGAGTVTVNGKDYTGTQTITEFIEGSDMNFIVTPPQDKVVDSIFYNGQELVDKVDYITVVKDAVLKITYRDDPSMTTPSITIYDKKPLNTVPTQENPYSSHTVYAQLTGWKLISDYGMKLSDKEGNYAELPGLLDVETLNSLKKCEGKFAVKIFGDGIDGIACTVTPYLVYNEETSYGESSEEFTGEVFR